NDPVRITRTSGTTGAIKTLIVPRRQHDARLERYAKTYEFDGASRYYVTMPMSVFPVYASSMACLRSGGTVVFATERGSPTAPELARRGVTHTAMTPLHLKAILNSLPDNYSKPAQLTIYAFGAGVSAALRTQTLERLATRVLSSYGSN